MNEQHRPRCFLGALNPRTRSEGDQDHPSLCSKPPSLEGQRRAVPLTFGALEKCDHMRVLQEWGSGFAHLGQQVKRHPPQPGPAGCGGLL